MYLSIYIFYHLLGYRQNNIYVLNTLKFDKEILDYIFSHDSFYKFRFELQFHLAFFVLKKNIRNGHYEFVR